MKVILIRHGDAEAEPPEGLEDDARALTPRARHQILPAHFAALREVVGPVELIFTSPLVRAVQTATLLAQGLSFTGPLRVHRHLYPDSPVGAIEALVGELKAQTVVLVGHQPTIGSAAALFLGMASFPRPVVPGTVIGVERPEATPLAGRLFLYAAPGQPLSTA